MTVSYLEMPEKKTVEFVVSGYISRTDYDDIVGPMQTFIDTHGTVKMLEVVESFDGFDPRLMLPGLRFDIKNLRHISHVAVVSDIGWFSPVIKAIGSFTDARLRLFELDEISAARAWLAEG